MEYFKIPQLIGAAHLKMQEGRPDEAEPLYREAIALGEDIAGHPLVGKALFELAELLCDQLRFAEADPLYCHSLAIDKKIAQQMGRRYDLDIAITLYSYGLCQKALGHYQQASDLLQQSLDMYEGLYGLLNTYVANAANELAEVHRENGDFASAQQLYQKSLTIRYQLIPPDNPGLSTTIHNLARLYYDWGRYDKAEEFAQLALSTINDKVEGGECDSAATLFILANVKLARGNYSEAEQTAKRCLRMLEQAFGTQHIRVADTYNTLGEICRAQWAPKEATDYYQSALAILANLPGSEYLRSVVLSNQGAARVQEGCYKDAYDLLKQSLEIAETRPEDPSFVTVLPTLGEVCRRLGRLHEADGHLQRGLDIAQKRLGHDHNAVSVILHQLAILRKHQGDLRAAEEYALRSLSITEEVLGPDHPEIASSLLNVASIYVEIGSLEQAIPHCRRAVELLQEAFPAGNGSTVNALSALADFHSRRKEYSEAETLCRRALAIAEDLRPEHGPPHPLEGAVLHNLALLKATMGDYQDAAKLIERSLTIVGTEGLKHSPTYASVLLVKGAILFVLVYLEEAAKWLLGGIEATWEYAVGNFSTMSRDEKQQFLHHVDFHLGDRLYESIFKRADDSKRLPISAESVMSWALLSKQLLFEAERQESRTLHSFRRTATPEWRRLWDKRVILRNEYRTLVAKTFKGTYSETASRRLNELTKEIERVSKQLRTINPAYAEEATLKKVDLDDVRNALQPGQSLAEYIVYQIADENNREVTRRRYGVLLVQHKGPVEAIPLGDAEPIDQLVREFIAEMADTTSRFGHGIPLEPAVGAKAESRLNEISAKLRAAVWQPIEQRLPSQQPCSGAVKTTEAVERMYIAPDGYLGLIAFEALAISEGNGWRYLAEDVELVYLNTGRDLARAAMAKAFARTGSNIALFLGNPDFGAEPVKIAATLVGLGACVEAAPILESATLGDSSGERPRREIKRNWLPVSRTSEIGERAQRRLQELGWQVAYYTGADAVKERVTRLAVAPRILQFSTHGYTLDVPDDSVAKSESPLLRSMLIFAGANRWTPENALFYRVGDAIVSESDARERGLTGGERIEVSDGVLTAYEVTAVDLRGTDLVNLTACKTGLGEITTDGVVGLRQAFLLAGCRALTMSMWSIPTDETVEQIGDFYSRWLADSRGATVSPYQAFRAAQLVALARARSTSKSGYSAHPFFWAGMIYAGDPGDLPERPIRSEPSTNSTK
jgi:tetratricopeptide (TPR) repeat protein